MFLQSLAGAAALPVLAQAQQAPQPTFPPVDERSVWLVGDSAPADPVRLTARLAELTAKFDKARDGYLAGGAVEALEKRFASLLNKESCVFLPTGSLANHIAVRVLGGERSRILVQHESHLYRDEYDAAQLLSGLNLVPLAKGQAQVTLEELKLAVDEAENGPHALKVGAMSIESPVRRHKGEMVEPATMKNLAAFAREKNIRLHLDGARLLLAPPEFDRNAYVALFDTVYVSLYKYLGAPFGAVLAGSKADIDKARALRDRFGGTIYQGWISAVLALGALDDFEARIAKSHQAARKLFAAIDAKVKPNASGSNIYTLTLPPKIATGVFDRMREAGVRMQKPDANGNVDVYVNETILRRPVDEIQKLFG
ncbi:threonine aldolase [Rhodospirillales bacterium TMPK1]|uniref:Threonine aldolase n=2 Tax=Roseiterribacter gracilis TaxID=2812848 RepID=A0A8S8X901_9PROT|nr:threonine aldolase [Rhodospirillales bacterium TMPK1]